MLSAREYAFIETLPFVLCVLYVFLAPFHKVEESFHLQVSYCCLLLAPFFLVNVGPPLFCSLFLGYP